MDAKSKPNFGYLIPGIFLIVAMILGAKDKNYVKNLTQWFVIPTGIFAFIGHLFMPNKIAAGIGWKTSPFQTEIAFTNLAFAVAGLLAIYSTPNNKAAQAITALGQSTFFMGAAITHFKHLIVDGNTQMGNVGPMVLSTISTALVIWAVITEKALDKEPAK